MLENNQNKNLVLIEDLGMMFATEKSKQKKRFGLYKCFCGNEFKAQINAIKEGNTKSCGRFHKEKTVWYGMTNHRLYATWKNMMDRCYNKDNKRYINYGSRGILVCDEWKNDFAKFINDMYPSYKEGLSIDRKDNDLGYSKDNCRWTTNEVQARNKRRLIRTNTSGYRGITFNKSSQKFRARICVNNKHIHIGYFDEVLEAAKAYDSYIIKHNLEHTRNFN